MAVGLRAWPLPAWIRDCIPGKKVMEAIGSDLGQAPLRRISMLKSRARNGMTGAGRHSARWSDESMGGNDFGRFDCHQRPLGGETSRSACGGPTTVLLRARQIDCRRIPRSLDTSLIAKTDSMDTSDLAPSRLRYHGQPLRRRSTTVPKSPLRRVIASIAAARAYGQLQMRQENFSKVFSHGNLTATKHLESKRPME